MGVVSTLTLFFKKELSINTLLERFENIESDKFILGFQYEEKDEMLDEYYYYLVVGFKNVPIEVEDLKNNFYRDTLPLISFYSKEMNKNTQAVRIHARIHEIVSLFSYSGVFGKDLYKFLIELIPETALIVFGHDDTRLLKFVYEAFCNKSLAIEDFGEFSFLEYVD